MKATLRYILVPLFLLPVLFLPRMATVCGTGAGAAPRPWQQVTVPSTSEVAANFKSPPREYGAMQQFQSWNGSGPGTDDVQGARISADLDRMEANGIFIINLSPGRRDMAPRRAGVSFAGAHGHGEVHRGRRLAKRNMRMWIQDESDYPSGFAGGYISERYPQLGMQDITADITVHVAPGQTLQMPVPADTLAIWATETDQTGAIKQVIPIPVPADMQLKYLTPAEGTTPNEPRYSLAGDSFCGTCTLVRRRATSTARTGRGRRMRTYSIIDYLDPKATDAFLHTVHETYYGAVGDQFGKIVLGFFGDEPDYSSGIPWTPKLLEEFKAQKGYDLAPYLPSWFDRMPIKGSDLARADYYDVWSSIFQGLVLRRAGQLGEGAQRGVPGPPEPRRDDAVAGAQRGRLLPRRALCGGSGHRQPEPTGSQRGTSVRTGPGASTTTSPSWPARTAHLFGTRRCGRKRAAERASTASTRWTSNWCAG